MDGSEEPFFDAEARLRLGKAVAAWIDAKGTNKRQLSISTRVSRTTIDEIIKGARPAEIETIARIAAALNTTLGKLLDGKLPEGQAASTLPATGQDRLRALVTEVGTLGTQVADLQVGVGKSRRLVATAVELLARELGLPAETIRRIQAELQ